MSFRILLGVAFALILRKSDIVLVALAWAFVISRIVHALIHLGPNDVRRRSLDALKKLNELELAQIGESGLGHRGAQSIRGQP